MTSRREFTATVAGLFASESLGGDERVSWARSETGAKAKLRPDTDNWSAIQGLLDVSAHVTLPAGTWPISRTLVIRRSGTVRGYGPDRTTLIQYGEYNGPVIGCGPNAVWNPAASGGLFVNDLTIAGLTAHQTANVSGTNCIVIDEGCQRITVENVRVVGSSYEGIVAASSSAFVNIRNFEAWNCGNGGPAYGLSTAGINATSDYLTIEDFRCVGCGQGVETGNQHIIVRRGVMTDPGVGTPSGGVSIGSTGHGIYDVTVEDCILSGVGMGAANGIGRLCGVYFRRNKFYQQPGHPVGLGFSGGLPNNPVPEAAGNPYEGPDLAGSEITDNELFITAPHNGVIIYDTGPSPQEGGGPHLLGRESLLIARNIVRFSGDTSAQTNPVFCFGGNITGECIVEDNEIFGLTESPQRGDIASYSNNANPTVPGMPNLIVRRNKAYDANNLPRTVVVKREGA